MRGVYLTLIGIILVVSQSKLCSSGPLPLFYANEYLIGAYAFLLVTVGFVSRWRNLGLTRSARNVLLFSLLLASGLLLTTWLNSLQRGIVLQHAFRDFRELGFGVLFFLCLALSGFERRHRNTLLHLFLYSAAALILVDFLLRTAGLEGTSLFNLFFYRDATLPIPIGVRTGGFLSENAYGTFIALAVVGFLAKGMVVRSLSRSLPYFVVALVLLRAEMLTDSRGGLVIAVVGGAFVFGLGLIRKVVRIRRMLAYGVIVVAAGFFVYRTAPNAEYMTQMAFGLFDRAVEASAGDSTEDLLVLFGRGRTAYSSAAIEIWKENPFFGVGLGSYEKYLPDYLPAEQIERFGIAYSPHNEILKIMAEGGLLGLGLLVLLYGYVLVLGWRSIETVRTAAEHRARSFGIVGVGLLVAFLLSELVYSYLFLFYTMIWFWLFAFLLTAGMSDRKSRRKCREQQEDTTSSSLV